MALMLAPYNDSMRLGMGFNSYTQTLCIDGAVIFKGTEIVRKHNPSQVVTYSSKFVERLSDIASSMNISYSSAIKKGTIEVAGNGNSIDEDKIKSSDLNLVVSVQVINQTITVSDTAEFNHLDKAAPGTQEFNDIFGDCYISGFIEGGDFHSIISMRCLDRSKASSTVTSIKSMAKTSDAKDFSLDAYASSQSFSNSSAMKDTEVSVAVNWMGGGQIKDPGTSWDVDSVYATAAAFPAYVAKTPQRTWAILTKYKSNRSYQKLALHNRLPVLEYDTVLSYTAELFNSFMEYKQLVQTVRDIIENQADFQPQKNKAHAIPTTIPTLIAVRSALRNEMEKIVAVTNVLARNPHFLQSKSSFDMVSTDSLVQSILNAAIPPKQSGIPKTTPAANTDTSGIRTPSTGASNAPEVQEVESGASDIDTKASQNAAKAAAAAAQEAADEAQIDLDALIPPEVWKDLLPIRTSGSPSEIDDSVAKAAAAIFPPPPSDDSMQLLLKTNNLKICAAVCGIHDVTNVLSAKVTNGMLEMNVSDIDGLVPHDPYLPLPQPFIKNLSVIYQVGDGPMRFASANYEAKTDVIFRIDPKNDPVVPSTLVGKSYVVAFVWGGKILDKDSDAGKKICDQIRTSNRFTINAGQLGDPWVGFTKTGIVYYQLSPTGPIYTSVNLQEFWDCELTATPQLATFEDLKLLPNNHYPQALIDRVAPNLMKYRDFQVSNAWTGNKDVSVVNGDVKFGIDEVDLSDNIKSITSYRDEIMLRGLLVTYMSGKQVKHGDCSGTSRETRTLYDTEYIIAASAGCNPKTECQGKPIVDRLHLGTNWAVAWSTECSVEIATYEISYGCAPHGSVLKGFWTESRTAIDRLGFIWGKAPAGAVVSR